MARPQRGEVSALQRPAHSAEQQRRAAASKLTIGLGRLEVGNLEGVTGVDTFRHLDGQVLAVRRPDGDHVAWAAAFRALLCRERQGEARRLRWGAGHAAAACGHDMRTTLSSCSDIGARGD